MATFVLDVNETLSDFAPLGERLRAHGAPPELARTWFASVLRDGFALSLHRRAPAFLDLAEQDLTRALTGLDGLDAPVATVVDDVLQTFATLDVHPDVTPGLRALAEAGHTAVAFSNGSARATRGLLERAGALDLVDRVLSVEDGSVWKPHSAAYAHAAEALRTATRDLTMVAVHPWDLDGAASAGMRTAWLDRAGLPWPAAFRGPDRRVATLGELAEG